MKNIFKEIFFEHISLNKIYCSKDSPVDIEAFIMRKRNYEDLLLVRHTTASEAEKKYEDCGSGSDCGSTINNLIFSHLAI